MAYALRHGFATDLLAAGETSSTVAELMGHTDTAMVDRVYSHIKDRTEHLDEAVGKIGQGSGGEIEEG